MWIEHVDKLIGTLGPFGFLVLGVAAMLEYVVPPFPGDTIVLMGGIYAVRGEKPWWLVLAVVTAGSVVGAFINYTVGHWLAKRFEQQPGRSFFGLTHARLEQVQARMRHAGPWLLLVNRFLPGIRGVIFIAAGAARMPRFNALVLGAISALAHSGLILALGMAVGGNLERLTVLVSRYQYAVIGLLGVAALAFGVRALTRRRESAVEP
ncbi:MULTISPECIES: DedA family protein [unclassified Corallococcus]|uniref:DedA family protein n=1 Tax=unclassified Corallococcus TaxID=2685029 RepID=UPI001A8FB142|nr:MULTISPECIES: DedA family protein [unclassified Corallococcus]MBN9682423.1 DedA family protein [Corallococcus sp. NCSPR001]WAS86023.1 DedA family protein [Corallococcus sp. NCRR]